MNDVSISLFADTDIGMRRAANEDSYLIADLTIGTSEAGEEVISQPLSERGYLMVVSDGMGGAAAGEIASDFAVKTLLETLTNSPDKNTLSEKLKVAAETANERIWTYAQENQAFLGMGATLTAVIACGAEMHIAQVGDSRAYLIRGGKIEQLTRDQSLAQALVDSGMIAPDQAHLIPQNVIIQALGTQPSLNVIMTEIELCQNDALLICSDGLSNKIKPQEMVEALGQTPDLKAAVRQLIDLANERGGEDNITLIISRFDGVGLNAKTESKRITGNFNAFDQNISYEEAAFIASKYVPSSSPRESEDDEEEAVNPAVTGVLRMPANFSEPLILEEEMPAEDASAQAAEEFFEKRRTHNERRSLLIMWVIAAISLLLLAVVGYFMLKPKPQPPPGVEQTDDTSFKAPSTHSQERF